MIRSLLLNASPRPACCTLVGTFAYLPSHSSYNSVGPWHQICLPGSHRWLYGGNTLSFLVAEGCGGGQKALVSGKGVGRCVDAALTSTGQDTASSPASHHPAAGSRKLEISRCPDLTLKFHYWPGQEQDTGVDVALVQAHFTWGSLSS